MVYLPKRLLEELTAITASGISKRKVSVLCRPDYWRDAAGLLLDAQNIAVISGFFVPSAGMPETDGPGGAIILARALRDCGRHAEVWTDSFCFEAMKACAKAAGFSVENIKCVDIIDFEPDILPNAAVFTERLGHAVDLRYYNMRKEDVSSWTPPLDAFSDKFRSLGIPTIGIGDGGNEVGMGNFLNELSVILPDYKNCLSVVKTDVTLPVDVSNWGCYALSAVLSYILGKWCGPLVYDEAAMLSSLVSCGAVDGVTLARDLSVDGLSLLHHENVIASLYRLWENIS